MNKYHLKKVQNKIYRQIRGRSKIFDKRRNRKFWKRAKSFLYTYPALSVIKEITGIQPMDGPIGMVYYLNIVK